MAFFVRQGNDHWPINKPTVVVVLFVGLFLLICIMAFGFYILKIQRYVNPLLLRNTVIQDGVKA
jgi:hypothetical protein